MVEERLLPGPSPSACGGLGGGFQDACVLIFMEVPISSSQDQLALLWSHDVALGKWLVNPLPQFTC